MANSKENLSPGSDRNNAGTNFEPSIVARVSGALKYVWSGTWFGPLEPMAPVAPPETAGRQMDYPTGYNINTKPRSYEPVSFAQMRAMADGLDILRLVIETRKDQLAALTWQFKPRDKDGKKDERCQMLFDFFQMPDKEHTWSDWLRMLLEDLFVLDAPTIYPRKTKGGKPYSFEIVDGATIKRVIDGYGRTPIAPAPAYQQILKGMPAVDYSRDELVYKPRNPRPNKVYGYSQVEQIIMTVNIALRRQLSQLSYYTDGSTPDLIFSVPESWNTAQIREFKNWWDEMLAGNIRKKRGTMFVPSGVKPIDTKDQILKDLYDEWLARIICYCFSVSVTPFIKETNRATAQTSQETAVEEGLLPLMGWVKDLINMLIIKYFGITDIVFDWEDQSELDPKTKAEVAEIYKNMGALTVDEIRNENLAKPPLTPEQKAELAPPPMYPDDGFSEDEPGGPPGKKAHPAPVAKARGMKKINRNRSTIKRQRAKLKKAIMSALAKSKDAAIAALTKWAAGSFTKADEENEWEQLSFPWLDDLQPDFEKSAVIISTDGATLAFAQISYNNDSALDQANDKAVEWSKNRSAYLVGKKWVDGELVDNPNPAYSISESTREGIKALVNQAEEEGWSNDRLTEELENSYQFSEARADMIARTETAFADSEGNMIAYRESGVVMGKQWLLAPDSCDECQANADQGIIDLNDTFQDGSDCAPAHPRCVCDVAPVVTED